MNLVPLTQTADKQMLFARLGLTEKIHKLLIQEAQNARDSLSRDPANLTERSRADPSTRTPYKWDEISETAKHRAILTLIDTAQPVTRYYYDQGRYQTNVGQENWVARWYLWHSYRYRDNRDPQSGKFTGAAGLGLGHTSSSSGTHHGWFWDPVHNTWAQTRKPEEKREKEIEYKLKEEKRKLDEENESEVGKELKLKEQNKRQNRLQKPREAIPETNPVAMFQLVSDSEDIIAPLTSKDTFSGDDQQNRPNLLTSAKHTAEPVPGDEEEDLRCLEDATRSTIRTPDSGAQIVPRNPAASNHGIYGSSSEVDSSMASTNEKPESFGSIPWSDNESGSTYESCEVHMDDALNSAMNVVKNLLMRELYDHALPDATDAPDVNASTSGSTGSSSSTNLASSSVASENSTRSKRTRENKRDPGDDAEDDSDDDDQPKKKGGRGLPGSFPHRRLKCPFYQREPEKFQYKAACRGIGFVDMAKLKDHIKRVHTQPLRCSRCWRDMESDEAFSKHLQQINICLISPEPQDDRIRPQVLKRLEFKNTPYSNVRNVDEKWKMIFRTLFPEDGDAPIPSPYEQRGMSP